LLVLAGIAAYLGRDMCMAGDNGEAGCCGVEESMADSHYQNLTQVSIHGTARNVDM
jgi:hypothetical protein